jgi:hypothetical protein
VLRPRPAATLCSLPLGRVRPGRARARRHWNGDYRTMGDWRLSFMPRFVRLRGHGWVLQLDDDSYVTAPVRPGLLEGMRDRGAQLAVARLTQDPRCRGGGRGLQGGAAGLRHRGDGGRQWRCDACAVARCPVCAPLPRSLVTWGLPELARFFILTHRVTPASLWTHCDPPSLQGLYSSLDDVVRPPGGGEGREGGQTWGWAPCGAADAAPRRRRGLSSAAPPVGGPERCRAGVRLRRRPRTWATGWARSTRPAAAGTAPCSTATASSSTWTSGSSPWSSASSSCAASRVRAPGGRRRGAEGVASTQRTVSALARAGVPAGAAGAWRWNEQATLGMIWQIFVPMEKLWVLGTTGDFKYQHRCGGGRQGVRHDI